MANVYSLHESSNGSYSEELSVCDDLQSGYFQLLHKVLKAFHLLDINPALNRINWLLQQEFKRVVLRYQEGECRNIHARRAWRGRIEDNGP